MVQVCKRTPGQLSVVKSLCRGPSDPAKVKVHFSGITSFGCVLGWTPRRRCCYRRFRPVVSPLLPPRLVLFRSCQTPQLPWAVRLLGT